METENCYVKLINKLLYHIYELDDGILQSKCLFVVEVRAYLNLINRLLDKARWYGDWLTGADKSKLALVSVEVNVMQSSNC